MSVFVKERVEIPLQTGVRSLCWDDDELVDWAGGGTRFSLSGLRTDSGVYFAYRFDRAVQSPAGDYAVLYEALGTKGLVVRGRENPREINRSYYYANAYEYPIALFRLPDGTQALAHCRTSTTKLKLKTLLRDGG